MATDRSKGRTITLVRHGETDGNVDDRAQGHFDAGLTQRGLNQALCAAQSLVDAGISVIYSSDLRRAKMTTKAFTDLKPEIKVSFRPDIRETHYGDYENKSWNFIRECDPAFFWKWIDWETRTDARFPNGESERDMWRRVGAFTEEMLDTHDAPRENILIVAHGGSLRALLARLLKLRIADQWRFMLDNASVTVLKEHAFMPSRWQAHLLNDIHHLKRLNSRG